MTQQPWNCPANVLKVFGFDKHSTDKPLKLTLSKNAQNLCIMMSLLGILIILFSYLIIMSIGFYDDGTMHHIALTIVDNVISWYNDMNFATAYDESIMNNFDRKEGIFKNMDTISRQQKLIQQHKLDKNKYFESEYTGLPNIIFILSDDQGWDDVSYHSYSQLKTPNIDNLVYEYGGIELNQYYIQCVCTPSRGALLSGRYPGHTGLTMLISPGSSSGLPLNSMTIADIFNLYSNYDTYYVGKWHLGHHKWRYTPTWRGFNDFYGFYSGAQDYFTHQRSGFYDFSHDNHTHCSFNCSRAVTEAYQVYSVFMFDDYIVNHILPKYSRDNSNDNNNYGTKSIVHAKNGDFEFDTRDDYYDNNNNKDDASNSMFSFWQRRQVDNSQRRKLLPRGFDENNNHVLTGRFRDSMMRGFGDNLPPVNVQPGFADAGNNHDGEPPRSRHINRPLNFEQFAELQENGNGDNKNNNNNKDSNENNKRMNRVEEIGIRNKRGNSNGTNPFFIFLSYQSVHSPLQVPESYLDFYDNNTFKHDARHKFAAMTSCMDQSIGNITNKLKQLNLFENTIIIFTSDNGGATMTADGIGSRNYPLRGAKHSVWEGGTRVLGAMYIPPYLHEKNDYFYQQLAYYKHQAKMKNAASGQPTGQQVKYNSNDTDSNGKSENLAIFYPKLRNESQNLTYNYMMHGVDWLPTLVEAAGIKFNYSQLPYAIDGVSHWKAILKHVSKSVDLDNWFENENNDANDNENKQENTDTGDGNYNHDNDNNNDNNNDIKKQNITKSRQMDAVSKFRQSKALYFAIIENDLETQRLAREEEEKEKEKEKESMQSRILLEDPVTTSQNIDDEKHSKQMIVSNIINSSNEFFESCAMYNMMPRTILYYGHNVPNKRGSAGSSSALRWFDMKIIMGSAKEGGGEPIGWNLPPGNEPEWESPQAPPFNGLNIDGKHFLLYNLSKDPFERNEISHQFPNLTMTMSQMLTKYEKQRTKLPSPGCQGPSREPKNLPNVGRLRSPVCT